MGCTASRNSHPETRIYDLLEQLVTSFENNQFSDEQIRIKLETNLTKIEQLTERLSVLSPFIAVEVQLTCEKLQKTHPKLYKRWKERFSKLKEKTNSLKRVKDDPKSIVANNSPTAPPSPYMGTASARHKRYQEDVNRFQNNYQSEHMKRLSIGSTASSEVTATVRNSSADKDPDVIHLQNPINVVRLKSFYQNTENNQSQDTLSDFGFFDHEQ
jgi:hypothetical protein